MTLRLDREAIARAFEAAVNMTAGEIEAWLKTEQSRKVGFKRAGADESVGHASGRRIVAIQRKPKAALDDGDYLHMPATSGDTRRRNRPTPSPRAGAIR